MKEYWDKMERLRKRINRKIHEIHLLRQRAEGMNGSGINDMPRTTSPDPHKIDSTVFKIMSLEQEVSDMQTEYDALLAEAERRIDQVNDYDLHDLLVKRYLESRHGLLLQRSSDTVCRTSTAFTPKPSKS